MGTKNMKTNWFSKYKKPKTNYGKTCLNWIPNTKYGNQRQEHEVCKKIKFKHNFILITYETINMKWNEQGYGLGSYIRLMLNKLKVMGTLSELKMNFKKAISHI
jgi:hypothetical protein